MADKNILVNLDLNQNELKKAVYENLAAAPSNPVEGQSYYNTVSNELLYWNGTEWVSGGGSGGNTYNSLISDNSVAMASAVGGIPAGTTVEDLSGVKTYDQILDDMLFPTVQPVIYSQPSVSISRITTSIDLIVEVGTPIYNTYFYATASRGLVYLNGSSVGYYAGEASNPRFASYSDTVAYSTEAAAAAATDVLLKNATAGDSTFSISYDFAAGSVYNDNKGNVSTLAAYAGGTKVSSNITINGTYPVYAATSGATNTSSDLVNGLVKQDLVKWSTTTGGVTYTDIAILATGNNGGCFITPRAITAFYYLNTNSGLYESQTVPTTTTPSTHWSCTAMTAADIVDSNGDTLLSPNTTVYVYKYISDSSAGARSIQFKF